MHWSCFSRFLTSPLSINCCFVFFGIGPHNTRPPLTIHLRPQDCIYWMSRDPLLTASCKSFRLRHVSVAVLMFVLYSLRTYQVWANTLPIICLGQGSLFTSKSTHKTLKGYWIKLAMIGYFPAQNILEKFASEPESGPIQDTLQVNRQYHRVHIYDRQKQYLYLWPGSRWKLYRCVLCSVCCYVEWNICE